MEHLIGPYQIILVSSILVAILALLWGFVCNTLFKAKIFP